MFEKTSWRYLCFAQDWLEGCIKRCVGITAPIASSVPYGKTISYRKLILETLRFFKKIRFFEKAFLLLNRQTNLTLDGWHSQAFFTILLIFL
jgi:hypothetical protein